ncbi:MAG: prolipoprotein diacylglyceryl transferase [Planctomycetota bacterium]|nr:MAG: prolipoprotein diacylglyceryl transferase [Planctomycetota bacterium]
MRPKLFHIPLGFLLEHLNLLALLLGLAISAYIIWKWIRRAEPFPISAGITLGGVFLGWLILSALKSKYHLPAYIPIYSYGFMLMLGFIFGIMLAIYRGKNRGISEDIILDLATFIVIGSIIGARTFYVYIESASSYANRSWTSVFYIWEGGLTFYGGLLGGVAVALAYLKIKKLEILKVADLLIPSVALGLSFGRIGCFLNGCCWGKVIPNSHGHNSCWFPYCWIFPKGSLAFQDQVDKGLLAATAKESLPVYFTQFYSWALALLITGILLIFARYFQKRQGSVVALFCILYGLGRFGIEFFRGDNDPAYIFSFTISQMVSLYTILFGITLGLYLLWKGKPIEPLQPLPNQTAPPSDTNSYANNSNNTPPTPEER